MSDKKKFEYEVFFTIEEKGRWKRNIDNTGAVCGVHLTYKAAKAAQPFIRKKIIAMYRAQDAAKKFTSDQ